MSNRYTSIGGQAVIEGVMMRSPRYIVTAVRKPSGRIILRSLPYKSLSSRLPILQRPILRGIVTLVESLFQGIESLGYSAQILSEGVDQKQELTGFSVAVSLLTAFVLGILIFVALPHGLTALLFYGFGLDITVKSPLFHLIDGTIKVAVLLTYVSLISLMPDIRRVFQYHGAEHKSIYSFEKGEELTIDNAKRHSTFHPRCGTSFLLFLILASILVFSAVFPLFPSDALFVSPLMDHMLMVFVKVLLLFPIAGIAYEFIRFCALRMDQPLFRVLIWPGLTLQRLTTREPDDTQLEVALASLRQVLRLEKGIPSVGRQRSSGDAARSDPEEEFEIQQLSDLGKVHATVAEFPE